MKIKINILKELASKESILICGLPGIAYIGKLSVDYLIKELGAELIGEVYSSFFPPYVLIRKDGIVELLKNELHLVEDNEDRGIFLFSGNVQAASPEGQYEIVYEILDKAINLGVKRVYSIAAYLTNRSFKVPKVYGTSTNSSLMEEIKAYGVLPMNQGMIRGMNGLFLGVAKERQLEGICLLGETRGFQTPTGQYLLDVKAAKSVLGVLSELLFLKLNMEPLEKQTEEMDELIMRMTEVERRITDEMRSEADRSKHYIT